MKPEEKRTILSKETLEAVRTLKPLTDDQVLEIEEVFSFGSNCERRSFWA